MKWLDYMLGQLGIQSLSLKRDRVNGRWVCAVSRSDGPPFDGSGSTPSEAIVNACENRKAA